MLLNCQNTFDKIFAILRFNNIKNKKCYYVFNILHKQNTVSYFVRINLTLGTSVQFFSITRTVVYCTILKYLRSLQLPDRATRYQQRKVKSLPLTASRCRKHKLIIRRSFDFFFISCHLIGA